MGNPKNYTLSSSNNIPQSMVALFQVLYASYTLYNTRGDQLNRYGYAAFGLTVIPYIIMSIINLLGNILTPGYPTLYLVQSPELEEAESRGAQINGIVGKVQGDDLWYASKGYFTGQMSYESNTSGLITRLRPEAASQKENDMITVELGEYFPDKDSLTKAPNGGILFPEYSRFQTKGTSYKGITKRSEFSVTKGPKYSRLLWWGFMAFFLGPIPYAVIGGLTHFRAAQSTLAQRVLTMFWLASGIFIGAIIPFIGFNAVEIIDTIRRFGEIKRERGEMERE
jgi:hypothetical protein